MSAISPPRIARIWEPSASSWTRSTSGVRGWGLGDEYGSILHAVRIGGVAQAVAEEVEGEDHQGHRDRWEEQPGRDGDGLHVLRLLEQDTPADRRRPQPQPEEAERRLADDHRR